MKKLVGVLSLLVFMFTGYAQEQERHQKRDRTAHREEMFNKMASELNLTAEQEIQVKEIMKESHEAREELREKYPERKEGIEEKKAAKEAHNSKMKEVLSAEQFVKYEELQKERKKRHMKRMHEGK